MQQQRSRIKSTAHRMRLALRCIAFAAVVAGAHAISAEVRFSASLDRDSILIGESVGLTLKFEGASVNGQPSLPNIPGIQVAPGISSSFSSNIGSDGTSSAVQSYTYNLVPLKPGEFVIPALQVDVGGQHLSSEPLHLKVLASDPSSPKPELANNLAFLSLVLPKKQLYVGEAMVVELRLYVRSGVVNVRDLNIPQLAPEGFNCGKYVQQQQYQRRVENVTFTVVPFLVSLVPVKAGDLAIGPLNGSVVALLPARESRDAFGFDSLFGPATTPRQVTLSVPGQTIAVLPLPATNVPPHFAGAVGKYQMTYSAGPTNLASGDPITLKIQISGTGPIESLTLPELSWKGFKAFPPSATLKTQDAFGLQGTKTFEQIVTPENSDLKALPPFSFSFFDPDKKDYCTLTEPGLALTIHSGGPAAFPVVAAGGPRRGDDSPPSADIVPIKQHMGALAQVGPPLLVQPWFLTLQGVPVVALLAAAGWRKRSEFLLANPRLRRRRKSARIIHEGLHQLRKAAAEKDSDRFFATLFRVLQEQLGERLDLPASAITEAVVEEYLAPRGVPEPLRQQIRELFQCCNLARYAPTQSSQELAAIVPKLDAALHELRQLKL